MVFVNSEPLPLNVHRNHPYSALLTIKDDDNIMDDKSKSSKLAAISVGFNGGKSIQVP